MGESYGISMRAKRLAPRVAFWLCAVELCALISAAIACTKLAAPTDSLRTETDERAEEPSSDPSRPRRPLPPLAAPPPSPQDPHDAGSRDSSGPDSSGPDSSSPGLADSGSAPKGAPDATVDPCQGFALALDGASSAVLPRAIGDDFTIEAWIRTTQSLSGTRHFQGRGIIDADLVGDANDFSSEVLNGGFAFGVGNPDITLQSTSTVATGQWVHLAASRAAATGELRVFVNGTLEGSSVSSNRGALDAPPTIAIGGAHLIRNFIGEIDEVRLWSVVRSAEQIRTTLRQRLDGNDPGLVGYFRFEDRGSETTEDTSGVSTGATLVGTPGYVLSTALCSP